MDNVSKIKGEDNFANDMERERLIVGANCNLRLGKADEYPERFYVPEDKLSWDVDYPGYGPEYYVAQKILDNKEGYADQEDVNYGEKISNLSYVGVIKCVKGHPLNPYGRTGLAGRGLLGKWGPNFAADPIITRSNSINGRIELLVIKRKDNGKWAIPGGMVDKNEDVNDTLRREFKEETGVDLDMINAREIYRGYVVDPRNTDNAWIETIAKHQHFPAEITLKFNLKAGDDAAKVKWYPLTNENIDNLYANHGQMVRQVLLLDGKRL